METGARTIRRCTLHFIHFPPAARESSAETGLGERDLLRPGWSDRKIPAAKAHLDAVQLFLSPLRTGLLRSTSKNTATGPVPLNRM